MIKKLSILFITLFIMGVILIMPKINQNKQQILPVGSQLIEVTPKGYNLTSKNGAYYIDGHLIVNKSYPLTDSFVPINPNTSITSNRCITCIDKDAYQAWLSMQSDAAALGLNLIIASGYRSFQYQKGLYENYVKKDSKALADTYSARPGHSEHQTGLSFDLNPVNDSFAATPQGKWINEHAYLYGFIVRYPKDKTDETGFKYEPWHLRYVGLELAKALFDNGNWLSMEDYFGLESKYID